jgi:hypothetical protein
MRKAQLKVNLRPVWDPTAKALAEVAQRAPVKVWERVWGELEERVDVEDKPSGMTEVLQADDEKLEVRAAERQLWDQFASNACLISLTGRGTPRG